MRYILSSALLLTSTLSAIQLDNRVSQLENEMQDVRVQTVYGNYGAQTATAYPSMNTWGFYTAIEGLYLKFTEGGTEYAWTDTDPGAAYKGVSKYVPMDWQFAFRVTAGYQFDCPDWDLWAEYMRYANQESNTVNTPSGGGLYSNVYSLGSISDFARSHMHVTFNTIDLNLGRPYFLRKNVSMHPFVGLRGAWINQHWNTLLDGVGGTTYESKQKNDYGGLGIRSGSSIRWHLNRDWSIFGSLSAALMWGQFSNYFTVTETAAGVTTTDIDLNDGTRRILPNMMADAGLTWQHMFARTRIAFTLAYEFDYWWRQFQTLHLDGTSTFTYFRISEDLGLQGVKLNMGLDF